MEFAELVRSRRTVHNFTADFVSREVVEQALALSLWAPNHKLSFPWVFTWVGPQARAALADLSVELKGKKGPLTDAKSQAIRASMMTPAHLIALAIGRSEPAREHEDYATLACSVQIASMFLWNNNIGSKWSTGGAWMHTRTYEILGLDPTLVKLEGGLLIGIPAIVPLPPNRPELANFVRSTP